jgi:hypothetical protein
VDRAQVISLYFEMAKHFTTLLRMLNSLGGPGPITHGHGDHGNRSASKRYRTVYQTQHLPRAPTLGPTDRLRAKPTYTKFRKYRGQPRSLTV